MSRRSLLPLGWLYSAVMSVRNYFYDQHIFRVASVDIPVISIGNIDVGGAGKTPLVEAISRVFIAEGQQVCVLSRGYRRESSGQVVVSSGNGPEVSVSEAGDEPFMLASLIPNLQIIVDKDRVAAAQFALEKLHPDILLLDDGFQHRSIARHLDIVIIPVEEVLCNEPVLPAGRLREPWRGLKRASHVLLTASSKDVDWETAQGKIKRWTDASVFTGRKKTVPELYAPVKDEIVMISELPVPLDVFAVAGIGNPEQFRKGLETAGINVIEFKTFPDHSRYPSQTQQELIEQFQSSGADYFVMTAKDYFKWDRELLEKYPIFFLPVTYQFDTPFLPEIFREIQTLKNKIR